MDNERIEMERRVVKKMIELYCKGHHEKNKKCYECDALAKYALTRLEQCKFGTEKPFCSKCTVHCYSPEKRELIKKIMRYSGPRILLYEPVAALRHLMGK